MIFASDKATANFNECKMVSGIHITFGLGFSGKKVEVPNLREKNLEFLLLHMFGR